MRNFGLQVETRIKIRLRKRFGMLTFRMAGTHSVGLTNVQYLEILHIDVDQAALDAMQLVSLWYSRTRKGGVLLGMMQWVRVRISCWSPTIS